MHKIDDKEYMVDYLKINEMLKTTINLIKCHNYFSILKEIIVYIELYA